MHIVVQARDLDASRIDGTRRYILEVVNRLQNFIHPGTTVSVVHGSAFNRILQPTFTNSVREVSLPNFRVWMQTVFVRYIFQSVPDVVWIPFQALPLLRPRSTRFVVTLHDLDFLDYPHTYPRADLLRLRFYLWLIRISSAVDCIAVSYATRERLYRYSPSFRSRSVTVVQHGVDREFWGERSQINGGELTVKETAPRLLFVGGLQPRKNVERLVRVFGQSFAHTGTLTVVGKRAWNSQAIVESIKNTPQVEWVEHADHHRVRELYQSSTALVFPSLSEGFGLPVLEALAAGTCVVTSLSSSLPEVGGQAAVYIDPHSDQSLTRGIDLLLCRPDLQNYLRKQAATQIHNFSWDRTTKKTAEVLEG